MEDNFFFGQRWYLSLKRWVENLSSAYLISPFPLLINFRKFISMSFKRGSGKQQFLSSSGFQWLAGLFIFRNLQVFVFPICFREVRYNIWGYGYPPLSASFMLCNISLIRKTYIISTVMTFFIKQKFSRFLSVIENRYWCELWESWGSLLYTTSTYESSHRNVLFANSFQVCARHGPWH